MSVVTTFEKRKREKQLKYERKLLRELSIDGLKKSIVVHFSAARIRSSLLIEEGMEEACFDVAIEAYLTGGDFSRFAAYGEDMESAKKRCRREIRHFTDTLFNFWLYYDYGMNSLQEESIYFACEHFVDYWWKEGYDRGVRRRKLRLT
ncbi:MAG TPA: DUF2521 family protein [Bacillaceae bacterium]